MQDTLVKSFLEQSVLHADKLCVAFKKERYTYSELKTKVVSCARKLRDEYRVAAGDSVMISAVSKPDYVIALLAVQYIGAISIPIDKLIKVQTLSALVSYIKPKILLSDIREEIQDTIKVSLKEFIANAGAEPVCEENAPFEPVDREAVCEMLFTTGTTGMPKGAMLAYRSITAITENTWHGVGMETSDVVLIPLPLNHSVGMRVLRTALSIGATIVIQNGFTFAKELEQNIDEFGCTALVSVPASIEVVRRQMADKFAPVLGKLRYIEFGAGSLSIPMKRTIAAELPNTKLYNTWGSSETGGAIFLDIKANPDKLGSLGKPMPGVQFAVCREDGSFDVNAKDLETAGRMALKGDMRMAGYFNLPDETALAIRGEWLVTNDLAYIDKDGFVYMLGRADDIINVGGEKVAPVEIENVAVEYPGVKECAVIAAQDKLLGQVPVLYYVMNDGATFVVDDFLKFMLSKVERFKLPQKFVELGALPRNRMLKLDRKELKRMWSENGDTAVLNETIKSILSRHSVREFSEEPVSKPMLETILKCAIQAPTAHNMQTWRFGVMTDRTLIARFKELLSSKAKDYKTVCYGFNNPAAAILVTNDERNHNAAQDSACAAENMMLAAHSLGLGSVWNNAISYMQDDPEVRSLLNEIGVPVRQKPWLILLLGHPANKDIKSPQRRTDVIDWIG